jgi:uncharacterized protein YndB with AHSA1/START domain
VILEAATYIHAPYEAVWNAFTRAESYAAWASAPCVEFGSRVGEAAVWGARGRAVYRGEILSIEHGRGIAHTFAFEGFGFDEPGTRVEIDLAPEGEVVRVAVRHDCAGAPRTAEMIGPLGWTKSLARLKTFLETGRAMPWPSA